MPDDNPARLELRGIRKFYPAVVANDGIDLRVMPGEVHAVLGENGAGKSTLMKIIYGVVKPDAGEILWHGTPIDVASPAHARQLGIGMVFQHFSLFETLTVAENVALVLPGKPSLDDVAVRIRRISERYGLTVEPSALVHSLSIGERQRVEIIRCLLQDLRMLIMDEPTSVLTPQATTRLFETLRQVAAEGCSVLYISHKLDEIKALCHRATVLRAGKVTGTCEPQHETASSMARLMIGRDLPKCNHPQAVGDGEPRLVVNGLSLASDEPFGTDLSDIRMIVRSGEILGIAGISGNGQQELLAALSGERTTPEAGVIRVCAMAAAHLGAAARRRLGLCFIPEERLGRAAIPSMSLADNALLTAHNQKMVAGGMLRSDAIRDFARRCIDDFDVRCGGPDAEAKSLSGGNLQKFIVGREVMQQPRVLIVSQPTWGVDVGASVAIRQSLIELRNAGTAVLVISEDLEELFEICDRIAVIANGRVSQTRLVAETDVEEIGVWMSGLWPDHMIGPASVQRNESVYAT
ncbi:MAG TPA: ABC transporter ATP-binding protein [Casimicrobiaceae bacterium]|nr:ABC transporter ATP-binding protein [Casimicrobiaceae bacterium]